MRDDGNVKLRVVTIVIEDVVLSWITTTKYEKEASCLKFYINTAFFLEINYIRASIDDVT